MNSADPRLRVIRLGIDFRFARGGTNIGVRILWNDGKFSKGGIKFVAPAFGTRGFGAAIVGVAR